VSSQRTDLFFITDLQALDPGNHNWFGDDSLTAMSGRCLLDVLEYLRRIPAFPERFRDLTNAHSIRLVCRCLKDADLDRRRTFERLSNFVLRASNQLREKSRKQTAPYYGDDYWDWAVILESFNEVKKAIPQAIPEESFAHELTAFYESVRANIQRGLKTDKEGEWYGPATATIAYRVVRRFQDLVAGTVNDLAEPLKHQALELIAGGLYRGCAVEPYQILWHYGQVVAEFGREDAPEQAAQIREFSDLLLTDNTAYRVYALARVLQGATKAGDQTTTSKCLGELYKCQNIGRPLGHGLLGENIKGSRNVLEGLWPLLQPSQKAELRLMVDALHGVRRASNTVGVVVAIPPEFDAIRRAFTDAGAEVREPDDNTAEIVHADYRVMVRMGKANTDAPDEARSLLDLDGARCVIVAGIAGSLGRFVEAPGGMEKFIGANLGHVVVATSSAPFRIRDKVRKSIENAKVPYKGSAWMVIPTDPLLFDLAHRAADQIHKDGNDFHEGLIVTVNGIKDSPVEKEQILMAHRGGLAIEEEGYQIGLLCMSRKIPYLIIRGISDFADGEKKADGEDTRQATAAFAAARLTVKVVELLSRPW
jgi:nucleoside phosphorylase